MDRNCTAAAEHFEVVAQRGAWKFYTLVSEDTAYTAATGTGSMPEESVVEGVLSEALLRVQRMMSSLAAATKPKSWGSRAAVGAGTARDMQEGAMPFGAQTVGAGAHSGQPDHGKDDASGDETAAEGALAEILDNDEFAAVDYDAAVRHYAMLSAIGVESAADNLGFLLERGHGRPFLGPPFAHGSMRILSEFALHEVPRQGILRSAVSSIGPKNEWTELGRSLVGKDTVIGGAVGFGTSPFEHSQEESDQAVARAGNISHSLVVPDDCSSGSMPDCRAVASSFASA